MRPTGESNEELNSSAVPKSDTGNEKAIRWPQEPTDLTESHYERTHETE